MTIFLRNLVNNEIVTMEDAAAAIAKVSDGGFEFLPEVLVDGATLNKAFGGTKPPEDKVAELIKKHLNEQSSS